MEPCVCTHGPFMHDAWDGDCQERDCWCTSYQPESTVYAPRYRDAWGREHEKPWNVGW